MLSMLLSAVFALGLGSGLYFSHASSRGWSVFWVVMAYVACQVLVSWLVGRRVKGMMGDLQAIMAGGQREMNDKANAWRFHPPSSIKQAQMEMQKMQHKYIEKAMAFTGGFAPFYKWSPMLKRQIVTLQMGLQYQDRNYAEVDKLMPKCLFMEPMSMAMRLARMYANNDSGLDKTFESFARRLRYGQGAVVWCLYAWIAVKRGDVDTALKTLLRADKNMENQTVKYNIDLLKNNKTKQFSLAGLGDEWYALGLEEPKIKMQRQPQRPR